MASEYLRRKYQNVKPYEEVELTPAEKRQNWWYYNKWWVFFTFIVLIGGVFLVRDIFFRPVPDYQVGFITKAPGSLDTIEALQSRIESLGEDVNGDGRVLVEVSPYYLGFDAYSMIDVETTSAGITRLTVDLSSGRTYIILLDNPEGFQARLGALSYLDGSPPPVDDPLFGANDWNKMVYRCDECPVLADINLENLYIGRRAAWNDEQKSSFFSDERLWSKLTEGAVT